MGDLGVMNACWVCSGRAIAGCSFCASAGGAVGGSAVGARKALDSVDRAEFDVTGGKDVVVASTGASAI